ncbi:calcium/sodium antiporter [soil metagenome]
MVLTVFLLLTGLGVLTAGAEFLVRGASAIAARLGLSPLVIGLTVVALGTSSPELVVSIKAALADQGGIAMGNVIGSNIFNVAAILGISALICPLAVHLKIIRLDMPIMLGISVLFSVLLVSGGGLARWEGMLLVAGLIAYVAWSIIEGKHEPDKDIDIPPPPGGGTLANIALVALGLAMLVGGGKLLVDSAVAIARTLGWSEAVIGLTIIAAGTSMPELATSVVAALRRQTDIAIGNVVGSNIFNILGIAGTAAVIRPVTGAGIGWLDLGAMLLTSALLLPLMRTGFAIVRWEGGLLLAALAAYLWLRWPA